MEFVYGIRARFPLPSKTKNLVIDDIFIYYHNKHLIAQSDNVDANKVSNEICTTMQDSCPDVFQVNGFDSIKSCTEKLSLLPRREEVDGFLYDDGNTIGCRTVHMFLAQKNNEDHCPHISLVPIEDKNGLTKCSKSKHLNQSDYFSSQSFDGFDRIANAYGMDPEKPISIVAETEAGACTRDFNQDVLMFFASSNPEFVCAITLSEQKATDEYKGQYWATLVGIIVLFRALSVFFLSRKLLHSA